MVELKHKFDGSFFDPEAKELIVSSETKCVWAVELDLLQEFMAVCAKYDIKWFIDGGSLLGAARHGGFVPWDDDIDVCMFRSEYEKLCSIAPDVFKEPYFFQTYKTDPTCFRGHAQLRNSQTTGILKGEMVNGKSIHQFNQGIFLDIFPMDNIPDDENTARVFLQSIEDVLGRARRVVQLRAWWRTACLRSLFTFSGLHKCIDMLKLFVVSHSAPAHALVALADSHDKIVKQYNGEQTKRCCTIAHWPIRPAQKYYKRCWFEKTVLLKFEMFDVPAPEGYEQLLTGLYGDWHRHVVGASLHGGCVFDVDKSYLEYLG